MSRLPFNEAFDISGTLGVGLEAVKRAPVPLILGGFLLTIVDGCTRSGNGDFSSILEDPSLSDEARVGILAVALAALAVGVVCCMVGMVVKAFLLPGYLRAQSDAVVNGDVDVGRLFSGGDVTLRMLGVVLLVAFIQFVVVAVGVVPLLLPLFSLGVFDGARLDDSTAMTLGLGMAGYALVILVPVAVYVVLGLQHATRFAALSQDIGVVEALGRSWELASGNRLWLLWYNFVVGLVNVAGLLACFIGVLVTAPLAETARTAAFLRCTRDDWDRFALR